ncbi:hypothetical protein B0H19DRAFT_1080294 [Mycena capillaripes]|nr:hypothetical protein B0H19DRAFT_1080294 [Mycena capillaripes]
MATFDVSKLAAIALAALSVFSGTAAAPQALWLPAPTGLWGTASTVLCVPPNGSKACEISINPGGKGGQTWVWTSDGEEGKFCETQSLQNAPSGDFCSVPFTLPRQPIGTFTIEGCGTKGMYLSLNGSKVADCRGQATIGVDTQCPHQDFTNYVSSFGVALEVAYNQCQAYFTDVRSRRVVVGLATPLTVELPCCVRAVYGDGFSIRVSDASRLFLVVFTLVEFIWNGAIQEKQAADAGTRVKDKSSQQSMAEAAVQFNLLRTPTFSCDHPLSDNENIGRAAIRDRRHGSTAPVERVPCPFRQAF